jgi:hypothetical protein
VSDTTQLKPNPCRIQFKFKNDVKDIEFELENYATNGPPQNEVPKMLKSTLQDAESSSSNVIFDLPHHDRVHTILLRYRDMKDEDTGFDICTIIRPQWPRDENNGFKRVNLTTIIRYIGLQESHSGVIETKTTNVYLIDDNNEVNDNLRPPKYGRKHELLKYI